MEEEFITCFAQQKRNLGYSDCPQHLAYYTGGQVVGFGMQASVMESAYR